MTNKKRTILILLLILFGISGGNAQDVIYSQFYANPLYLNPALAGSKIANRVTMNYRNQWAAANKGFVSYSSSWDQHFEKISGGLGVMINTDIGGGGTYNRLGVSGIYSYRLQATRYIVFNAAIQTGYIQYRLDWNKLLFGDQINISTGNIEPTQESMPPKLNIGKVDFSAGILGGYKESMYFGVAVNHLSRPDMSFYDGNSNRLALRWTVHYGILIDFFQGMSGRDYRNFAISPNIIYIQQGNFRQVNVGLYMNKQPFVYGLWLRHTFGNPDAMIALLGFQQRNFKIGYSFDYTVSRLSIRSGGAHEITVALLFHRLLTPDRYHHMKNPEF